MLTGQGIRYVCGCVEGVVYFHARILRSVYVCVVCGYGVCNVYNYLAIILCNIYCVLCNVSCL